MARPTWDPIGWPARLLSHPYEGVYIISIYISYRTTAIISDDTLAF